MNDCLMAASESVNPGRPVRMSKFERIMFTRTPLWVTLFIFLAMAGGAIVFGAVVRRTVEGGTEFGALGRLSVKISNAPSAFRGLLGVTTMNAEGESPRLRDGLWVNPEGGLVDSNFLLVSRYREEDKRYVVELLRLSDGKIVRRYAPDTDAINARSRLNSPLVNLARDRTRQRYFMEHPFLKEDGGLVFKSYSPLVSVSVCGTIDWTLDGYFHHSLERDQAGDFWVSGSLPQTRQKRFSPKFREDAVSKVSQAGQLLYQASVHDILENNALDYITDGRQYNDDPYHLNDIQPVESGGPHWKRGDVFLSFRHFSAIILFRPSTGKVIWWRQGPWLKQHDVQILDNHRIALFDNRVRSTFDGGKVMGANRILILDFRTNQLSSPYEDAMRGLNIRTLTQGRQLILSNGDAIIEETDFGRIVRLAPDGTERWRYISARADGTRLKLGWSRYIDANENSAAIRRAMEAKCQ